VLQHTGSALLAERANDLRDLKQRVLRACSAKPGITSAGRRHRCCA
jgi:phosphoenolpyruvate-protein kinase (PTS system EI component)